MCHYSVFLFSRVGKPCDLHIANGRMAQCPRSYFSSLFGFATVWLRCYKPESNILFQQTGGVQQAAERVGWERWHLAICQTMGGWCLTARSMVLDASAARPLRTPWFLQSLGISGNRSCLLMLNISRRFRGHSQHNIILHNESSATEWQND